MMSFFRLYSVNLLSLVNIIFSFLFTLLFALYYKVSSLADSYFFALIIYSNIFIVIQLFYSTFFNIYLHTKDEKQRNNLYYMLQFILLLVALIVIGIYFLMTSLLPILNETVKTYLDIYIFTLLLAPLIDLSIQLMNAEKEFYYAYLYPIGRNIIALILLLSYQTQTSLVFLAYGFILYDFLFFIMIFSKAIRLLKYKTVFFDKPIFFKIIHKSFMDRTGQFFLAIPELLISNLLITQFPGILSIYSYIRKFIISLIQFIFTPQLTVFSTNVAYYLQKDKLFIILLAIKKLWFMTLPYYVLAAILLAFIIKNILAIFLTYEIIEQNLFNIYIIFLVLFLQNMFVILEYPYGTVINQKLLFYYALKIKLFAFVVFTILFIVYKLYVNNLQILLSLSIIPSLILFIYYRNKTLHIIDIRNKSC